MSITDELRAWAKGSTLSSWTAEHLTAIADHIDAEHERICYDYQREHDDWVYIRDTCWVELPKDADGEYIHIGDRMENGELVARIVLTDGSWKPTVYTAETPNQLHEHYCHDIRHYHAPTVEDVIRDAILRCVGHSPEYWGEPIAECAAKLRLAGEDA